MSRLIKIVHNAETGEVIEREYTDEEYAQYLADQAETKAIQDELAAKAAAKAALLEKLGITEDEARLLLA